MLKYFAGLNTDECAAALGVSRRAVQAWVRRSNRSGVDGLRHRAGQGRRGKLSPVERQRLVARMESGPRPEDQVCTLRGRDFQRILRDEFGKLYHLNGVYALLHRLGYSCLMPRPRHRKADARAQEAFKKTLWGRSKWTEKHTPTSAWKSGSKMRPASANKAR